MHTEIQKVTSIYYNIITDRVPTILIILYNNEIYIIMNYVCMRLVINYVVMIWEFVVSIGNIMFNTGHCPVTI